MHGGGELVAAWTLQALREEHSLSVLAFEPLRLEEINRACGTDLRPRNYRLLRPGPLLRRLGWLAGALGLDPHRSHRYGHLMWLARRLRGEHDLLLSAFSEADLGGAGIQYVHEPRASWLTDPARGRRITGLDLGARAYRALHGYSAERMRANLTATNSAWSARRIERALGVRALVVPPPAPGRAVQMPWERREQAVVAVGRLVAHKRFGEIIEIVERVRASGSDLRLQIAGRAGDQRRDRRYLQWLSARVAATGGWASLHEDLPRAALLELLGSVRYGLHAFRDEPFGIAVAEMLRAGCIPFAHRGGGVPEILGTDELLFTSPSEAVRKLLAVIGSEADQRRLRGALAERAEQFSEEVFVRRIRELVRAHAASRQREPSRPLLQ
jgi:glycosyltransferase involved in cell wall biosynthesis